MNILKLQLIKNYYRYQDNMTYIYKEEGREVK